MKAIIVEDEFPARKELRYLIEHNSKIEVIEEFDNGLDVLSFIQSNDIDAIFLDINIPKLDGMMLAKTINKFHKKPKIVFITAYETYAVEAFSLEAFDYILKPYSEERILSMLSKIERIFHIESKSNKEKIVEEEFKKYKNKISIWKGDKIVVIDADDIYYCEANEKYTNIYTEKDMFELREGISEVENLLNSKMFFRCHRSYLVNLSKIEEIIPWFNNTYILKLNNEKYELAVSRGKIKQFRTLMNI